ncbi:hypothetical protein F5B19DRAFT_457025 [Rostrohypoxylon terebratum]|nr:hypothetical protein F5B19DRAFT_457025 [Rostrohypoxylon terebratum]
MDPPTLTGKPTAFWLALREDLQRGLNLNRTGIYFRAYGSAPGVYPGHWPLPKWSMEDFAYFFDCPEMEAALASYVNEYLRITPKPSCPSWWDVVSAMNSILADPTNFDDYLNVRPVKKINKANWSHVNHIAAFIFRLLHYRNHLQDGTPATRDSFQTRQANYAASFGKFNPFYGVWATHDKWACAFLLFTKLSSEREGYFKGNGGPIDPHRPKQPQPVQKQPTGQQPFGLSPQKPQQPQRQQPAQQQPKGQQPPGQQPPGEKPTKPVVYVQPPLNIPPKATALRNRQQAGKKQVRFADSGDKGGNKFADSRSKMYAERAKKLRQRTSQLKGRNA